MPSSVEDLNALSEKLLALDLESPFLLFLFPLPQRLVL